MRVVSLIFDIILVAYIVREVLRFIPRYRELKQEIANGDAQARTRIYYQALAFEWISAGLAMVALGFDCNKLNPRYLELGGSRLIQSLSLPSGTGGAATTGLFLGIAMGTAGFIVARLRANRRGAVAVSGGPTPWWRKVLPDFSALIPVTTRERILWAALAISAGVCEEVVFRGWLLATLHGLLGLGGTALVLVAAVMFGLAHAYQRITGMVLTALAGLLFCVLYIKTGSLLVPILLHVVIDLRFAFLPTPRAQKPQTAYA